MKFHISKLFLKDEAKEAVLLEASIASISNHKSFDSVQKKYNLLYMLKYIVWFTLLIFIAPYKKESSNRFICATTPNNYRRLKDFCHVDECVTFARLNSDLGGMRKNKSILSPFSFIERINILFKAVSFYFQNKNRLKGYIHFILEYYAVAEYMTKFKPKTLISSGMYDRYCTLFTYLAKGYGIESIGVQDGAAIDINVPYKVYCDKMYAFDEFEVKTIKKFMMKEDCEYILMGFKSYLKWEQYPKTKKLIAIASQDWFTGKTKMLIRYIAPKVNFDEVEIIVYPHYRENVAQYKEIINEFSQIKIVTDVRHSNIDVLITFYSTIVYDFWSVNQSLPVVCLHINGFEANYYRRENVYVAENMEEVVQKILA